MGGADALPLFGKRESERDKKRAPATRAERVVAVACPSSAHVTQGDVVLLAVPSVTSFVFKS
mgnify:CR=1